MHQEEQERALNDRRAMEAKERNNMPEHKKEVLKKMNGTNNSKYNTNDSNNQDSLENELHPIKETDWEGEYVSAQNEIRESLKKGNKDLGT